MIHCKKLLELPVVASEWQQVVWCPDCEHYELGKCSKPLSAGGEHICSQDGKPLSVRVVTDSDCDSLDWDNETGYVTPEIQPCFAATEHAIRERILQRTCRRIEALKVEVSESVVTIQGDVACFHLKQLALQGVLDVVGDGRNCCIELNIRVEKIASPSEGQSVEDGRELWEIVAEEENHEDSFSKP